LVGGRVRSDRTLDPWLLTRILAFAVATRFLVRLNPSSLRRVLARRERAVGIDSDLVSRITDHVDLALRIGRPLVPAGCLPRGLTLYHFLSGAGADLRLHFGLGVLGGNYEGHCWLEQDGVPILELTDPRPLFPVMFTIP
jgi:hypothetical protein